MSKVAAGLWWAFVGVLLFSLSIPMTAWALEGFSPYVTATGRAVIAGALAAILLRARRVPWPTRPMLKPLLFTMAGAVFGWPILIALALERTTSAHAAVIAAIMPLVTAVLAVARAGERMPVQFWAAASLGTGFLVIFAATRGGLQGTELVADLLILLAVLASSWCYVEGAILTRLMPGWQVISWVVVLALPITVPLTAVLLWLTQPGRVVTAQAWTGLVVLGVSSMYVGFFAWYRGLAEAGVARGSQMQQLQAPLTLVWSVILLGEVVTLGTALSAVAIVACVAWAQWIRFAPDARVIPPPT